MSTAKLTLRVLALDVGKKRIGLAMTDPLGIIVQGLPTYKRTTKREDLEYLARLCQEYEVQHVLVGRPLHMSGDESPMSRYTAEFGAKLGERTGLTVEYVDERLTSFEAGEVLRELGRSTDRKTGNVDRMAAILMLQEYLDRMDPQGREELC
ncbi:MAG: Holliday junction resolvase RuvX [Bryobacteraceae bacterium]|nr:Holliday junction resolvase RuvX [Bryobacteraceae bacterium]